MKLIALLFVPLLAGCPTMSMTPEQLKASAGMATCGTTTNMYGGRRAEGRHRRFDHRH